MTNALSIDVEDYFQVSAFESCIHRKDWDTYPLRVESNTRRILDILDENQVRATFFVLGWVAERIPSLVKDIALRGHEVASHGYGHRRVYNQTREEFREDIRKSKYLLEDISGDNVSGYRAPSYSISKKCLWAFDELLDAGYTYDSSVFPIRHDLYGIPDWPRFPFALEKSADGQWQPCSRQNLATTGPLSQVTGNGSHLTEIPITTLNFGGKNIPIAGGGYFRLFPYPFTKWGLGRINKIERRPFIFYMHPWEIDPDQPRISNAGLKSRTRHYLNLQRTEKRLKSLLSDFRFLKVRDIFRDSLF